MHTLAMAHLIPIPTIPPQNTILYTDDWTPAIDNWFIEKLAAIAMKKNETLSWKDIASIRMAQKEVNDLYDTEFSFERCVQQFLKLVERHNVFSFITSLDTVYYDETNNIVYAFHNYIWDYIVLKHELGKAYVHKGEPAWNDLCTIFGTPSHANAVLVPEFEYPQMVPEYENTEIIPEYIDLTSSKDNNVEIVDPNIHFPRHTFDMHKHSGSSSFWDDMAQFGIDAWSDPSVCGSQHSFDSGTSSFVTPQIIPLDAWPKPGSIIIIDSPRPKHGTVPVNDDSDRVSSTGSSGSVFKHLQRLGKEKR